MHMKKLLLAVLLFLSANIGFTQTEVKLNWQINYVKTSANNYTITAKTTIPEGWHLYGNNPTVEGLTTIQFNTADFENDSIVGEPTFKETAIVFKDPLFNDLPVNVYEKAITVTQQVIIKDPIPAQLHGTIEIFLGKGDEFISDVFTYEAALEGGVAVDKDAQKIVLSTVDIQKPIVACGESGTHTDSGWLKVMFLGFLGGLIALLTPCVFPMIPVTVSFFTKRSSTRKGAIKNGVIYGLFIFLIYVAASIPFHLIGNVQPEIFNNISTSAWLNVVFFVIFIFFSISFFGFFEITLPSGIASKADSKSGLGSIGGIFFMALTLAIVSFSCTGPILGSLLVGTASGGAWQLTAGLAGFGLALALPFALFAIFPNWLQSLPKSGGWLDTVKKVLAFLELALAFKFLSNADLVMHWGLLKREVFVGIWALVSIGLTLYCFGILRLPHDYKGMKITSGRKLLGVVAFLFTLYLIPGVTNTKYATLKFLSGFPPPLSYSLYDHHHAKEEGLEPNVINDYNKALALSKEQNKPILIDFTGWACVNCRKMEENVWTEPEVSSYIKENFILLSLYVDDKAKLPITERFSYTTLDGNKKEIVTIGDKWATFQAENFKQVTQPLYVVLNNKEQLISNPVGYTPNVTEYLNWLKCSKDGFTKQ